MACTSCSHFHDLLEMNLPSIWWKCGDIPWEEVEEEKDQWFLFLFGMSTEYLIYGFFKGGLDNIRKIVLLVLQH